MSGIDEFLAGATAVAPVEDVTVAEEVSPSEAPPSSTEPSGVVEIITPSGIQIYYQAAPRRLYRIRLHADVVPEGDEEDYAEWREVVSCSKVTGILDKPGLVHWGEEIGVKGVQELLRQNFCDAENLKSWSTEMTRDLMKRKGLRTWQSRDKAADRGTSVHRALEGWAMSDGGELVSPEVFPQAEQGYVIGLNRFLSESGFVPTKSEVIVASLLHGLAGRFDLMGRIPEPVSLVTKLTKAGKEHRETVQPDSYLCDLKTSSGIYDEYHLQVAGYQGMCVESGYEKPNQTAILRVSVDGKYEFKQGVAEWLDFWWAKGLYDSLAAIKERVR